MNEDGNPSTPFALKDCEDAANSETCAYWTYSQGTSMAAPHATGVAALTVSEYGRRERVEGGPKLNPNRTERILLRLAQEHACPRAPLELRGRRVRPEVRSVLRGRYPRNGFYGHGIVNAYDAVLDRR